MSIKETFKSKKLSIAANAVIAFAAALLINTPMIATNAQENNTNKKPNSSSQRKTNSGQPETEVNSNGSRKNRNPMNNSEYKTESPTTDTSKVAGGERSGTTGTSSGLGGLYIATTTGVSGGVATGGASGLGRGGKGGQSGGQGAGTKLQIQINKFISDSQIDQLETASANGELAQALSKMNCGTVVIGGKTITINAAIGGQNSNGGVIYLLSAQTFSTQGENGSGAAGAVGFIEMRVKNNAGNGSMYTTTQVAITNGSVAARGGASTAVQLTIQKSASETGTSQTTERGTTQTNSGGESVTGFTGGVFVGRSSSSSSSRVATADVNGDGVEKPQSGSRNAQRSGSTSAKKKP